MEYAKNKHIANKILFANRRGCLTTLMQYGIVISNHTFDTLYVIVIPAAEA
jgi:hypothetical protein